MILLKRVLYYPPIIASTIHVRARPRVRIYIRISIHRPTNFHVILTRARLKLHISLSIPKEDVYATRAIIRSARSVEYEKGRARKCPKPIRIASTYVHIHIYTYTHAYI